MKTERNCLKISEVLLDKNFFPIVLKECFHITKTEIHLLIYQAIPGPMLLKLSVPLDSAS